MSRIDIEVYYKTTVFTDVSPSKIIIFLVTVAAVLLTNSSSLRSFLKRYESFRLICVNYSLPPFLSVPLVAPENPLTVE